MQGKNLAFFASFGKAAGIAIADKSRTIRFLKNETLLFVVQKYTKFAGLEFI